MMGVGHFKQHEYAPRLLEIIRDVVIANKYITYSVATQKLGLESPNYNRNVAKVCDLLDAAAAYSVRPLLALVVVRQANGKINQAAFASEPPLWRQKIINSALSNQKKSDDIDLIRDSLSIFKNLGLGNKKAWKYVQQQSQYESWKLLIDAQENQFNYDAINDLDGSSVEIETALVTRYARNDEIRKRAKDRAGGVCEGCGSPGFMTINNEKYLEVHHIISLADQGPDDITNVIALCANCHRQAHYGIDREKFEIKFIKKLQKSLFQNS